eukprot:782942_1
MQQLCFRPCAVSQPIQLQTSLFSPFFCNLQIVCRLLIVSMGSSLTITNNRENEVWWVLEENHKGYMMYALGTWAGAAIGGLGVGVATAVTLKTKEKQFREQMIGECRYILRYNDRYTSPKHSLSLLRRITAKRFDRISGKYYTIAFDAWSGARDNSVNRYY